MADLPESYPQINIHPGTRFPVCLLRPADAPVLSEGGVTVISVLATGIGEWTMKELVLPVPEVVSAIYAVPVAAPISTVEARRQAAKAVETGLTGPLRALTTRWLAQGAVKVEVEPAGPPPAGLLDKPIFGTPEQRVFIARARAFVKFSATQRASLMAIQDWQARGPAASLAVGLGAPVLDPQAVQVLTAEEALAALPDTAMTIPASRSDDVTVGLAFKPWVRVHHVDLHDVDYLGMIALMTDGMRRFGLPELRMGPVPPGLREELVTLLNGVAFKIWSDLLARAQDTPNAKGLVNLPRFLRVPAEMDVHRRDLDRANGVPNRGGTFALVGLRFDPASSEDPGDWLTICPPASWDTSWEDFIADTCHGMFGFEKPRWHYIPEFGALLDALAKASKTLPEARSRFLRGDLPPGGRLMVRHETPGSGELWWARVEFWEDAGHAVVRDTGRELTSGVRLGPPVAIETGQILDWGIWVDGKGVIEGADTEGLGHHLS
jgi:hypothetical protein